MSRISYTLTPEMVQEYLKRTNEIDLSIIKRACDIFGISFNELLSSRATAKIANCRKALCLYFRNIDKTKYTLTYVGTLVRCKPLDHATIIKSVRDAMNHYNNEAEFKERCHLLGVQIKMIYWETKAVLIKKTLKTQ